MKVTLKRLLTVGAALGLGSVMLAGTVTAEELDSDVDVRIQPPLRLTEITPMSFGDIVVINPEDPATYTLNPDGSVGETNVIEFGVEATPGEFSIAGRTNEWVGISFNGPVNLYCQEEAESSCEASQFVTVDNFTTDQGASIQLTGGAGNRSDVTFFVGAELQIPASVADGLYEGTYTITAGYE